MTRREALALFAELARNTSTQIDLINEGWTMSFNSRYRSTFGCCIWRNKRGRIVKRIEIATAYMHLDDETEDTIRHEVAHAFDYEDRRKSDHSYRWKRWAVKCGANPKRTSHVPPELMPEAKWSLVCPNCQHSTPKYNKPKVHLPRTSVRKGRYGGTVRLHHKPVACGRCCNKLNHGRWSEDYVLTLRQNY